jgi:endonuclease/exonuclease/phosphatase family metal-dependent hydrolase
VLLLTLPTARPCSGDEPLVPPREAGTLRVATFNCSLNREEAGQLERDLQQGSEQASAIAAVIRTVQPDILLVNEIDYSDSADNAGLFQMNFLAAPALDALGNPPWPMPHHFAAPVNTGVPSGMDLNANGKLGEPDDAWGYGKFPGQYGMAVLSRLPLDVEQISTLQKLPWSAMPGALRPQAPDALAAFYDQVTWTRLRLASKSFWDVPVQTPMGDVHILASHPTPPAFDGPEDRNGCRNHDEIRLIQDYVDAAAYLRDDRGEPTGLKPADLFVVLGDLNSDPIDGGSRPQAIKNLLAHPRVAQYPAPRSRGAVNAALSQGKANRAQRGDAAEDTGDFSDFSVGNLRIDYVLPSNQFTVVASGVFWPVLEDVAPARRAALQSALSASDHHLVWLDLEKVSATNDTRIK